MHPQPPPVTSLLKVNIGRSIDKNKTLWVIINVHTGNPKAFLFFQSLSQISPSENDV